MLSPAFANRGTKWVTAYLFPADLLLPQILPPRLRDPALPVIRNRQRPAALVIPCRQVSKVGAVCRKVARTALCIGRVALRVPTAILNYRLAMPPLRQGSGASWCAGGGAQCSQAEHREGTALQGPRRRLAF